MADYEPNAKNLEYLREHCKVLIGEGIENTGGLYWIQDPEFFSRAEGAYTKARKPKGFSYEEGQQRLTRVEYLGGAIEWRLSDWSPDESLHWQ